MLKIRVNSDQKSKQVLLMYITVLSRFLLYLNHVENFHFLRKAVQNIMKCFKTNSADNGGKENWLQNGVKRIKNASFRVIITNKFRPISVVSLFAGEKMILKGGGRGRKNYRNSEYLLLYDRKCFSHDAWYPI